MAAPSDSEDALDEVGRPDPESGDDEVVSSLQRKELTELPSADPEDEVEPEKEPENFAPTVAFVDPYWDSVRVCIKEFIKSTVWQIPSDMLLHAPLLSRSGAELKRVEMKFDAFCEISSQRAAVAKALVNELGHNFVASRLIFAKIASRPNGAVALLPVTLTECGGSMVASELVSDGAVPCFIFPPSEVQNLVKPGTSSSSAIPKQFAKNHGQFDMSPPPFSKEGPLSWIRVSEDVKRRVGGSKPRPRTQLLVPDEETPSKKAKEGPGPSSAPPEPPVVVQNPTVALEGLRTQPERRVLSYSLDSADFHRTLPVEIPPGFTATVSVELTLDDAFVPGSKSSFSLASA